MNVEIILKSIIDLYLTNTVQAQRIAELEAEIAELRDYETRTAEDDE